MGVQFDLNTCDLGQVRRMEFIKRRAGVKENLVEIISMH